MTTENNAIAAPEFESGRAEEMQNNPAIDAATDFAPEEIAPTTEESLSEEAGAGSVPSFLGKSKEELLELFSELMESRPVQTLRAEVDSLKVAFYRLRRAESETARRSFVEAGGREEEFTPEADEAEARFKELYQEFRRRRDLFVAQIEEAKEANLKAKQQIIEELKALIDSDEKLDLTFNRFRELQGRWKEIGTVPQQQVKDLWETYNLYVEKFYDFVKINKELRDLDLKKNGELKTALCEQAEALAVEQSVVVAFHKLQKLHDEWREIGPVPHELRESLWERFKSASTMVNRRHQEFFESAKREQQQNLERKRELCERVEELAARTHANAKEWTRASDQIAEIQKVWRTIGFAPKKENTAIYERFRAACDRFFEAKRAFFANLKGEMEESLRLRTELCEQAEALRESEEWRKTTDQLIALQARWKQAGNVPIRQADALWKRFRSACDAFFERKAAHYASVDGEYAENLARKEALLQEMEEAVGAPIETIRDFQRRWNEIGFVPMKQKEALQKRYKAALDALFSTLRGAEHDRSMSRFREKVSSMRESGDKRLRGERERLYNRVRQYEQEIAQLENNIGFFAHSKGAEAMIAEVRSKIERMRQEMQQTIEKVKLIDAQNQE